MDRNVDKDQDENNGTEVRKPISLWHAVCITGLVILYFYLYKWK